MVHLPVFQRNAYQRLLMDAQRELGLEAIDGGAGGNFFRTALMRWKADILHFHWLSPYMIRPSTLGTVLRSTRLLIELSILKLLGQRIVWTLHNLKNHDNRRLVLERWFTKRFVRLASAITAYSQPAAAQIRSAFAINDPGRIRIIPQLHRLLSKSHLPTRGTREAGTYPGRHRIFIPGTHLTYKGVMELICEFKTLPPDSCLVIAGTPADAEIAQTVREEIGAAQNIIFHPRFVPGTR